MTDLIDTTRRSFDVVIFDLGSTLIWFDGVWPAVVARQHRELTRHLAALGYQIDQEEFANDFLARLTDYYRERETEFIEHTIERILRAQLTEHGYPDAPSEHLRPALDAMYAITQAHWRLEEDAKPTLERLRKQGYRLALISNANDAVDVHQLIDLNDLRHYFETVLVSAEIGIRKPHPRIFEEALRRLEVQAARAVMVGDTLGADILGARNAGLSSIWITRRADTPDNRDHLDTIQPDATVATLEEIPALLSAWRLRTQDSRTHR